MVVFLGCGGSASTPAGGTRYPSYPLPVAFVSHQALCARLCHTIRFDEIHSHANTMRHYLVPTASLPRRLFLPSCVYCRLPTADCRLVIASATAARTCSPFGILPSTWRTGRLIWLISMGAMNGCPGRMRASVCRRLLHACASSINSPIVLSTESGSWASGSWYRYVQRCVP